MLSCDIIRNSCRSTILWKLSQGTDWLKRCLHRPVTALAKGSPIPDIRTDYQTFLFPPMPYALVLAEALQDLLWLSEIIEVSFVCFSTVYFKIQCFNALHERISLLWIMLQQCVRDLTNGAQKRSGPWSGYCLHPSKRTTESALVPDTWKAEQKHPTNMWLLCRYWCQASSSMFAPARRWERLCPNDFLVGLWHVCECLGQTSERCPMLDQAVISCASLNSFIEDRMYCSLA